jgi:hypothetical protein
MKTAKRKTSATKRAAKTTTKRKTTAGKQTTVKCKTAKNGMLLASSQIHSAQDIRNFFKSPKYIILEISE